ncbi:hypothetical protein [Belnapia rosea]|jgi:hypothetical protein|uniref:Uncharacterized protein n=1 Tax=Belnapia rosea TaxID=938405 RepID=A0A1G6JA48_9PROT|nr:hypothetical protein [Belnapia rosea]SDB10653.1 hypothetical protein SAMN02927895_00293 [Belnapia rosea]SDC15507.1 hypothetical protein SAMN04487779_1001106 [Belnapia rosea]
MQTKLPTAKPRRLPAATADAADSRRRSLSAMIAHKRRCREAGAPDSATIGQMVNAFLAAGGAITACPPAYVLPVQNGAGRQG